MVRRWRFLAVLLKAVRSRPDAARSRPDTARNSTVERSERNKLHINYIAQYLHFVVYKTNMENEKNNVTSRYAETYTTINCKA